MMRLKRRPAQSGFTLIELLVAMSVFSFLLLIVVSGILNIMRIRNQTMASNNTQDSARAAMNELVRAVRDSSSVESATPGPSGTLCLIKSGGSIAYYYVESGILKRRDNCLIPGGNVVPITNSNVQVANFDPAIESIGPTIAKKEIKLTLTIATAGNSTTTGSGASIVCNSNVNDRAFCSSITLTSGAVAR